MNAQHQPETHPPRTLVVIGASTGGTRVVAYLLRQLPVLRACVVIVQHMPKFINVTFTRSLSRCTQANVRLAEDGISLGEGHVLVAPSEMHCRFAANSRIRLEAGPSVNFVCPSIDVAMQSLRPLEAGQQLIGVLLTGMGKDGAVGLAHIKKLGGLTIAQDAVTCAVHGMPAAAAKLGCVDYELPPEEIVRLLADRAQ